MKPEHIKCKPAIIVCILTVISLRQIKDYTTTTTLLHIVPYICVYMDGSATKVGACAGIPNDWG